VAPAIQVRDVVKAYPLSAGEVLAATDAAATRASRITIREALSYL
jgi:hypothetical protein